MPVSTWFKKRYKSAFPAANTPKRDEPLSVDKVIGDVPAIASGVTQAVLFVGTKSNLSDPYPIRSDGDIVPCFQDNIRERGAPLQFISDGAKAEILGKIKDILRYYSIGSWHSEPHNQHQNPCERRIQDIKRTTNIVLNRSGSPAEYWLLALSYVCYVLNHTWNHSANGIPLQIATGQPVDTSMLFCFRFGEPVYYASHIKGFQAGHEDKGEFVGFAEDCGHIMTFLVLTAETREVISRSAIRSALDPSSRNLRLDDLNDTIQDPSKLTSFIRSYYDLPAPTTTDNGEKIGTNAITNHHDWAIHVGTKRAPPF